MLNYWGRELENGRGATEVIEGNRGVERARDDFRHARNQRDFLERGGGSQAGRRNCVQPPASRTVGVHGGGKRQRGVRFGSDEVVDVEAAVGQYQGQVWQEPHQTQPAAKPRSNSHTQNVPSRPGHLTVCILATPAHRVKP